VTLDPRLTTVASTGLQLGSSHPLLMRRERVELFGERAQIRLLYASDLHLRGERSQPLVDQLLAAARCARPDALLLGGDLVDSRRGPEMLARCVASLSELCPVLAVSGNHDRFWGLDAVRAAVERGGGLWLSARSVLLPVGASATLRIDGALADKTGVDEIRVLCAHDPAVFEEAARAGYALVFAGHLHGGQCVLAERRGLLYPGAFLYRWNGLRFCEGDSTMLVSRGAADTLPVRWNCPREVIACEIC
jgi:uncharacterized protein